MVGNGADKQRLGDMLIAADLITSGQLDAALAAQQKSGLRLGKQLVQLGHVSEVQVTQTLSNQLSVPWVSLNHIEFSAPLLQRVPAELADRYSVLPIYVRSVRGQGDTLYVAMDDPTDADALREVSGAAGLPVRPMVASPSDIRATIERRYYGAKDSEPAPPRAPKQPAAAQTRGELGAKVPTGTRVKPPPPKGSGPRKPEDVPLDIYAVPSDPPKAAAAAKSARTLTLLDGTTIALPSSGKTSKAGSEIREVRHLMKSVIVAQKAGAAGDPPSWEEVMQVLLDVTRDRGVTITRRDFAQAWLRHRGT